MAPTIQVKLRPKRIIKRLIFLLLACTFSTGQSQNTFEITGSIIDKMGQPVDNVEVSYLINETGVIASTVSNVAGEFILEVDTNPIDPEPNIPDHTYLGLNFPNPFNPGTSIPLQTNEAGSFTVYDVNGRQVSSINIDQPGEFTIHWGGQNQAGDSSPAGLYIYNFRTAGTRYSRKMVLLDNSGVSGLSYGAGFHSTTQALEKPTDDRNSYSLAFTAPHITDLSIDYGNGIESDTVIIQEVNRGPYWVNEIADTTIILGHTITLNLNEYVYDDGQPHFQTSNPEIFEIIDDSLFVYKAFVDSETVEITLIDDEEDGSLSQSINVSIFSAPSDNWIFLGLENMHPIELRKFSPHLYAVIGGDGLWRLNVEADSSNWVYLGLSEAEMPYEHFHVQDVIVNQNNSQEMLITALTTNPQVPAVFKSIDDGNNWFPSSDSMGYVSEWDSLYYYGLPDKLQSIDEQIIAVGSSWYSSNNFGESWALLSANWLGEWGTIRAIDEFTKHSNSVLWVGGESVFFSTTLAKTYDGGASWTHIALNVPQDNIVSSIAVHPIDPNTVYLILGLTGWLLKTTDAGEEWMDGNPIIPVFENPYDYSLSAVVIDPDSPGHVLVAGGPVLFESFDSGSTWSENENHGPSNISEMFYYDSTLYIATTSGIYIYSQ